MSDDDFTFTIWKTDDGIEMMVEVPAGARLFKTERGLSHRVILDGPPGGVLSAVYRTAMLALEGYAPERED